MILKELNEEKKKLFAMLMESAIELDGKTTYEEMTLFEQVCLELNIDLNTVSNNMLNFDEILCSAKEICNRKELRAFAVEIITLVCIDKEIDEEENKAIKKLKNVFDISDDDIEQMFRYVKDLIRINADLDLLINN